MISKLRSAVALAAVGLALTASVSRAELLLSGTTFGNFADPSLPNTTVTNGAAESTFASGTPFMDSDTPTTITFTSSTFMNVTDGGALALGAFNIKNGITLLNTTASSATFDLFIDFASPALAPFKLTTLTFSIDTTSNNGTNDIPDLFAISYSPLNSLVVDGYKLTFSLDFTDSAFVTPPGKSIAEDTAATTGDVYAFVDITPLTAVPEPSTYAIWGALLILAVIAFNRLRAAAAVVEKTPSSSS